MVDHPLRVRVERLLRNTATTADLSQLLRFARDNSDNRQSVQEVGHFDAHYGERDRGVVTRVANDLLTILSVKWPRLNDGDDWKSGACVPCNFLEYLKAVLRHLDPLVLKKECGLKKSQAERMLSDLKLCPGLHGSFRLQKPASASHDKLVRTLCSFIISKAAFDDDRLFSDFSAVLKGQGILKKEEVRSFNEVKPFVTLYAMSVMHNRGIKLSGMAEPMAYLSLLWAEKGKYPLAITAMSKVPARGAGGDMYVGMPIFNTKLDSGQCI